MDKLHWHPWISKLWWNVFDFSWCWCNDVMIYLGGYLSPPTKVRPWCRVVVLARVPNICISLVNSILYKSTGITKLNCLCEIEVIRYLVLFPKKTVEITSELLKKVFIEKANRMNYKIASIFTGPWWSSGLRRYSFVLVISRSRVRIPVIPKHLCFRFGMPR